mgnify:CR=1 FL=1
MFFGCCSVSATMIYQRTSMMTDHENHDINDVDDYDPQKDTSFACSPVLFPAPPIDGCTNVMATPCQYYSYFMTQKRSMISI